MLVTTIVVRSLTLILFLQQQNSMMCVTLKNALPNMFHLVIWNQLNVKAAERVNKSNCQKFST